MSFYIPTYKSVVLNTLHKNYAKAIFIDEIFFLPFVHDNNAIYIFQGNKTRRGNFSFKIYNYKTKKYLKEQKSKIEVEKFLEINNIKVEENFDFINSVEEFNKIEKQEKKKFILRFLFDSEIKLYFDQNKKLCEDEELKISCKCCSNKYLKYLRKIGCMNYKIIVSEHNYKLFFA